jgi:hypothetical protein
MPNLRQDIDDLDRMVDTGATKDAVRSQIRLIDREVVALQSDHASLYQAHTELEEAHAKLIAENQRRVTTNQQLVAENAQLKANAGGIQFESIDIPRRSRIDGLL